MINQDIEVRKVKQSDMPEVINLLQSISNFKPSEKDYKSIWKDFNMQENVHNLVGVLNKKIVGYGTILIETKIRGGKLGHIEDIVSDINFSNIGIGKRIMKELVDTAESFGCYKIVLQCKDQNKSFYKKCGFENKALAMQFFLNQK